MTSVAPGAGGEMSGAYRVGCKRASGAAPARRATTRGRGAGGGRWHPTYEHIFYHISSHMSERRLDPRTPPDARVRNNILYFIERLGARWLTGEEQDRPEALRAKFL